MTPANVQFRCDTEPAPPLLVRAGFVVFIDNQRPTLDAFCRALAKMPAEHRRCWLRFHRERFERDRRPEAARRRRRS